MIEWSRYRDGHRQDDPGYEDAAAAAGRGDGFVWVRLHDPDEQALARVAADFSLHPLAVEDAAEAHQLPKVDRYADLVFVSLKVLRYTPGDGPDARDGDAGVAETGEVMIFVGDHFVVTVTHRDSRPADRAGRRVTDDPQLLRHGPPAILYAIVDDSVDTYLDIAERFDDEITGIEESVFADARANEAERLHRAKRQLLTLRRAVVPLAGPLHDLSRRQAGHVPDTLRAYLRDVSDHLDRAHGLLTAHDEVVNSMLQANLAQLSVVQNDDMRTITSWAAIIAVPTAIAGIYGMNFTDMPELHWTLGYPAVLTVMALVCAGLYWNFRRRGWL